MMIASVAGGIGSSQGSRGFGRFMAFACQKLQRIGLLYLRNAACSKLRCSLTGPNAQASRGQLNFAQEAEQASDERQQRGGKKYGYDH